jgi:hypothetical protein
VLAWAHTLIPSGLDCLLLPSSLLFALSNTSQLAEAFIGERYGRSLEEKTMHFQPKDFAYRLLMPRILRLSWRLSFSGCGNNLPASSLRNVGRMSAVGLASCVTHCLAHPRVLLGIPITLLSLFLFLLPTQQQDGT